MNLWCCECDRLTAHYLAGRYCAECRICGEPKEIEAMRHEAARQRQSDGRWDYTSDRNGETHAIGYCSAAPTLESFEKLGIYVSDDYKQKLAEFAHKFHTDGHATHTAACACYREYLLDFRLQLHAEILEERHKCAVCGEWTGRSASIELCYWWLCEQHCNRDEVAKLFPAVGESWKS